MFAQVVVISSTKNDGKKDSVRSGQADARPDAHPNPERLGTSSTELRNRMLMNVG